MKIVVVGDSAGGAILNSNGITSTLGGAPIAVEGDAVTPHGDGIHSSAVMTASSNVTIGGHRVVVEGDLATCGHAAVASHESTIE